MVDHTFVILAYKESEYLENCIKSILNQTLKGKIIIATSTPNNHITKLAEQYGLQVIINPQSQGIGGDFDFAIDAAQSKYVTVVHQDDTYDKNYLKEFSTRFSEDCIIIFSDYAEIRNEKLVYRNTLLKIKRIMNFALQFSFLQSSKFIRRRVLSFGNPICCPAVTFNKSIVKTPLFVSDYKLNVDWQAWEKLSRQKGKFIYLTKPLMHHRVHAGSTTSQVIGETGRSEEDYRMFLEFWPSTIAKLLLKQYSKAEKSNNI